MAADLVLQARGLTKDYNGFLAVQGVDLDVRRHAIHALIGPNGAGKTTCFNLLTRFVSPTRGTILFDGEDISQARPDQVARRGLVRSFQISAVFPRLTVLDNVRVALQRKEGLSMRFWRRRSSLDRLNDRAAELLASVGLSAGDGREAGALPYGRRRALEIATTLALDPKVMLLDEPMSGLGREDIAVITELIRRTAVGRTVLMVEHNLQVVASLCDTITVLRRGEVLAQGDYASITRNPEVVEAYLGREDD